MLAKSTLHVVQMIDCEFTRQTSRSPGTVHNGGPWIGPLRARADRTWCSRAHATKAGLGRLCLNIRGGGMVAHCLT
eukprot:7376916-Prymnesium_polylepis.1